MVKLKKEWIYITLGWMVVFASDPLYMYYAQLVGQFQFRWDKILSMWMYDTCFMLVFLVHHFLLAPRLLQQKRRSQYAVGVVSCLVFFTAFLATHDPKMGIHEQIVGDMHLAPNRGLIHHEKPYLILAPPDMARLVMVLMMIGADLGYTAIMSEQRLRQRLLILEKQNLKQELEHLRYQINPHFFMNTLNNIYVLIDIDQERARDAVVELSKLMRYSLYQGNETLVSANHEIEFIRLYISLMRLRYTNKVEVNCSMPDTLPESVLMPPLLLATFVENAFKHGVSYREESFINVSLALSDDSSELLFHCSNSRHPSLSATNDGQHGIGLENVRKRLDLQYGDTYSLCIDDQDTTAYNVCLTLPV